MKEIFPSIFLWQSRLWTDKNVNIKREFYKKKKELKKKENKGTNNKQK